ncbi:hypothetical protein [Aureimonas psammosilenae]|uniref:hypothetical protein n=1 Tax=Aureimonas psammosilenae TaxID=2495496 RepID=UPI0012609660|nr:hypothetical protein [Aureimonas psammosilenae]
MEATDGSVDALAFAKSYLPNATLIWIGGERNGQHRLDAFHHVEAEDRTLFVLSTAIEGVLVPDVVSFYPHIPYDTTFANARPPRSDLFGVFAWVERVHSPMTTEVRFTKGGSTQQAVVREAHALIVEWDTPWPSQASRPGPEALLIEGTWQPTVSSFLAATGDDLRRGYWDYYDGGDKSDDWAVGSFREAVSFTEKVAMVEAVLAGRDLSDFAYGCLAAGPVEDLISDELLDYVTAHPDRLARWVPLLQRTYWHAEPAPIRQRLKQLLG